MDVQLRRNFLLNYTQSNQVELNDQLAWKAIHIYLPHSHHTSFLCEVILPALREENLLDNFFFLRYWQGGPHLRLRLRLPLNSDGDQTLRRILAELERGLPLFSVTDYDEYNQGLLMQEELARLEGETPHKAQPIGSIVISPYEPEYHKYGGKFGVEIAEEVFCKSSLTVFDFFKNKPSTLKERHVLIGEAAQIITMFLHGAGLTLRQSIDFLQKYEDWWRHYAPQPLQDSWPRLYTGVSRQVQKMCTDLWINNQTENIFHEISSNATNQARLVSNSHPNLDLHEIRLDGTDFSGCLSNYIHTTNNRLGLVPAGEGMVAYLVRRGLEDILFNLNRTK